MASKNQGDIWSNPIILVLAGAFLLGLSYFGFTSGGHQLYNGAIALIGLILFVGGILRFRGTGKKTRRR